MKNFRCFDELSIDFDEELTVVIGKNGSFKSFVLDRLAIMLSTVLTNFDGPNRGFQLSDARKVPVDLDSKEAVTEMSQQFPESLHIDEVDSHLHPMWQQQIGPKLRQTLPRVQLIVTTHFPQVLSTVDASRIRILDGSTVREAEFSERLRSDIILSSVMVTDPEPAMGINATLQSYAELADNGEGARARRLSSDEDLIPNWEVLLPSLNWLRPMP
ncbi:AAA family ATPase [Brevibacterium limosum]|uniref:AAA family ATPase n=1 Tax=Brevibacterium limosum TaxID=2697565 RepID=UPI001423FFCB|nr:AAA family ATPase [Brevibacterium limosum]